MTCTGSEEVDRFSDTIQGRIEFLLHPEMGALDKVLPPLQHCTLASHAHTKNCTFKILPLSCPSQPLQDIEVS